MQDSLTQVEKLKQFKTIFNFGLVMRIIDVNEFEKFSPVFRGDVGHRLAEYLIRLFSIDKVNWVYEHSIDYQGAAFAGRLLNDIGVDYWIGNAERLQQLPEGAFITVSNHPYGGIDGIMMIDLFAGIRPDYKFMVNHLIALVKTLKENFITVSPLTNDTRKIAAESIQGIRETLTHLKEGHPMGFFPSGAVSDLDLKDFRIRDRKWQKSILNLIHSVRVPILPVRFFDGNSPIFYMLGLIHWRIRSLRMAHEVFNKSGKKVRIGIGAIISAEEQADFPDAESLGDFLRKAVYGMPKPDTYTARSVFNLNPGMEQCLTG